ncbi:MAG TPA: hypothetical protein VM432_00255, partial [Bdellovibrionales bacterium]|nr:hypothetical protein [Bdellovibrionales bacterium]
SSPKAKSGDYIDSIELDEPPPPPKASEKTAEPAPVVAKSVSKPKRIAKRFSRLQWDTGITIWTEKTHLVSPAGKEFPVISNGTGLLIGADLRRGGLNWGWIYQFGLIYATINSQAPQGAGITYQKGRDAVYGAQGGAGAYYRIPGSRVEFSLLGQAKYRQANYTTPAGYSFGNDSSIIAGFAEVDLMMPINKWLTIFQQYSMPLWDKRLDSTWVFGIRI